MSLQNLRLTTSTVVREVSELVGLWRLKASLLDLSEATGCFEVSNDLTSLSIDVVSSVTFSQGYGLLEGTRRVIEAEGARSVGQGFSSDKSEIRKSFEMLLEVSLRLSARSCLGSKPASLPLPQAIPLQSATPTLAIHFLRLTSSKFREAERVVHTFLQARVNEARKRVASGGAELCLLDTIVQRQLDTGNEGLKPDELRDELLTVSLVAVATWAWVGPAHSFA